MSAICRRVVQLNSENESRDVTESQYQLFQAGALVVEVPEDLFDEG